MTHPRRDSLTATTIRLIVPVILGAYGFVLATSAVGRPGEANQIGGPPGIAPGTGDVVVMIALVAAGAVTWFGNGSWRTAGLAIGTGLAWLAPHLPFDPGILSVFRLAAIGLTPVLTLHLALAAASDGHVRGPRKRILLGLYLIAVVLAAVRVVMYDPFYELECVCGHVPAIIEPPPGVRLALRDAVGLSALAAGALLAIWSAGDLASAGRSIRRRWILSSGAVTGSTTVALAGLEFATTVGSPVGGPVSLAPVAGALAWLLAGGLVSIAAGVGIDTIWRLRARSRLRRLADDIEAMPPPGSLETALEDALGDPGVAVGYWLADEARFVGADGAPFGSADQANDRATTTIERGNVPVAIVRHRPDLDTTILRDIGPSLRIALDNERLRAAGLAHLRDLQTSRARIVEVSDAERRRAERDLHDGAQQGLLAVVFDVRLARLAAERRGDQARAERLSATESNALSAVEELRRIAHGVHPAVLTQAGLILALESLRDISTVQLDVRSELAQRPPAATEAAAYRIAVETLVDATRRGAQELRLRIHGDSSRVVLEATDDGAVTNEPSVRIADRVGAAGGEVSVARRPNGLANIMIAVLPCA